jgi:hypothetical protein
MLGNFSLPVYGRVKMWIQLSIVELRKIKASCQHLLTQNCAGRDGGWVLAVLDACGPCPELACVWSGQSFFVHSRAGHTQVVPRQLLQYNGLRDGLPT